jgi:hypothetical protein
MMLIKYLRVGLIINIIRTDWSTLIVRFLSIFHKHIIVSNRTLTMIFKNSEIPRCVVSDKMQLKIITYPFLSKIFIIPYCLMRPLLGHYIALKINKHVLATGKVRCETNFGDVGRFRRKMIMCCYVGVENLMINLWYNFKDETHERKSH